jgi:hypothetical protein
VIQRLVFSVGSIWARFDGQMGMRSVDPLEMPFERFLNLVYAWYTEGMDETEIAKFDAKLWMPVKGAEIPKESPWSPENEQKAFSQFKAAVNG